MSAYHTVEIKKGVLGKSSKIQEELDELLDAEKQGVKILIHCELADLYGALRECAHSYDLSMEDLRQMVNLTAAAFKAGDR
jgi:phosphoribosyl-ATP pyrophosphohydrolase